MEELRCAVCGGPYHPATGHVHSETCVLCGRCAINFYWWYRDRMTKMSEPRKEGRRARPSFTEAAATSVRP